MIGLLIQDNAYEQDIRELLMSFYPGETYAHEVKEGVDFYVQTIVSSGSTNNLFKRESAISLLLPVARSVRP